MRLLSLCIYTHNYTMVHSLLTWIFQMKQHSAEFFTKNSFSTKNRMEGSGFLTYHSEMLHFTQHLRRRSQCLQRADARRLTDLLGGSPVLNKEGGEVKSAFADGSAASFSAFPVLPCCTLEKRGVSLFNETLKDGAGKTLT